MRAQESESGMVNKGRREVSLGSTLEKSLSAYASAAVAAGVSLLAMTNSAEAKIVYTPAQTNIPVSDKDPVLLDLNHDGIADFSFWNLEALGDEGEFFFDLAVGCAVVPVSSRSNTCRYKSNMIWGQGAVSGRFASALHAGVRVRPAKAYFQQGPNVQFYPYPPTGPIATMAGFGGADFSGFPSSGTNGQWAYTKYRYLGLQFMINSEVHYGWARVAVTLERGGIGATLTGYAYETIPNKPIVTGKMTGPDVITLAPDKPSATDEAGTANVFRLNLASLGHLAQGESGIPVWRKSGGKWKPAAH